MYKENKQMTIFSDPVHFIGAKLDQENRWVKISQMIPWDEIEGKYKENFSKEMGRSAKPVRMALGSHLIDALHKEINPQGIRKSRTYRRKARKECLRFARNRNPRKADIQKAIKKQLSYLGRNLKTIAGMGKKTLRENSGTFLKCSGRFTGSRRKCLRTGHTQSQTGS